VSTLFILAIWWAPDPAVHALLERLRKPTTGGVATQCVRRLVGDEQLLGGVGIPRAAAAPDGLAGGRKGRLAVESLLKRGGSSRIIGLGCKPAFGFRELTAPSCTKLRRCEQNSLSSDSYTVTLDRLTRDGMSIGTFTAEAGANSVEPQRAASIPTQHLAAWRKHHQSVPARR